MLASAVRLRGALGEQDKVLNDPASRGLSVGEVLEKLAASRKVGASESARFDRALDAYRQVVGPVRPASARAGGGITVSARRRTMTLER